MHLVDIETTSLCDPLMGDSWLVQTDPDISMRFVEG
jgi:hypothetical protein